MSIENSALEVYAIFLFLSGICCLIHFTFFLKRPKRIDSQCSLPEWHIGVGQFIVGGCVVILTALLGQTFVAGLAPSDWLTPHSPKQIVLLGSAMNLFALAALIGLHRAYSEKFPTPFFASKLGWSRSLPVALYAFLALMPLLSALTFGWTALLKSIGIEPQMQDAVLIFAEVNEGFVLFLMILLTVVLAPVTEEIVFRGYLYRFIKGKIGILPGLFASGLLFALLHHNILSLFPLLVLGIALAYVYELTGDIKVPIVFHAVFNLNTVMIIILEHDLL